jgi:hypothetical protein
MLEILILFKLCRNLGNIVRAKGRQAAGYQFMLVAMWFCGEFGGAFTVGIICALLYPDTQAFLLTYLGALIGAVLGAFGAFRIAHSLPSVKDTWDEDNFMDEEEDVSSLHEGHADAIEQHKPDLPKPKWQIKENK